MLPWTPDITYDAYYLRLSLPCRPWVTASRGIGGVEVSAAGVPAAYEVRRDQIARVSLRFREWEWPQVQAWIEWAQRTAQPFRFRFDWDHSETEYLAYLDAPRMGEDVAPRRSTEFPEAMEIDVELRYAAT